MRGERADGAKILRRFDELKTKRNVVEESWRDCYRYTFPLRGVGFETMGTLPASPGQTNASTAQQRQAELLDSTGTDATRTLAAALMSGLTPANSRWFGLEAGRETGEEKRWLDESANTLWELIHASNYDSVGFECMLDLAIAGQFALFVDELPDGGLVMESWPLANTYVAASTTNGPVDVVMNEYQITGEQAAALYGEDKLSEKVRERAKEKPDEMVEFVRAVYPRTSAAGQSSRFARNLPFASCHVEKASRHVVRESGYHELPVGCPRWNQIPGSAYSFGPVFEALPDLRTLNKVCEFDLANMDLATAGMWGAVDDGVLNARSIKIGPRKVVVMAEKDNFWPLQPAGNFQVAALEIERLQRSVRRTMMADQLEPQQKAGTPPTATEIVVRVEMIRQLLGPVYGRQQSEFLQWFVTRCFGLAYRGGAFTRPPRSLLQRAAGLSVKYSSPIARAQKSVDVAAMDRYEASLGAQAQAGLTDALDMYDWDASRRHRAELLGVPMTLIPDQEAIDATREARSKQQQSQAVAQRALQVVRNESGDITSLIPGMPEQAAA